jgi:hypothetical protein
MEAMQAGTEANLELKKLKEKRVFLLAPFCFFDEVSP